MNLRDVLQMSEFTNLTDQQALDSLLTVVDFPRDSQLYHWNGVVTAMLEQGVNPTLIIGMVGLLSQCPGWETFDRCVTNGFDFSSDTNRAIILGLEVNDPPEAVTLLNAMLAIGRPTGPRWKLLWLSNAPQLSDITAARTAIATEVERNKAITAWNNVINAFDAGSITTYTQSVTVYGAN